MLSVFIIHCLLWSPIHGYSSNPIQSILSPEEWTENNGLVTKQDQLDFCEAVAGRVDADVVDARIDSAPENQVVLHFKNADGETFSDPNDCSRGVDESNQEQCAD